jgi:DNA-binding transcriptional MerR regulator/effector-binding domain-containing protein
MFSIGEFARHGRVSVRMLRHYDEIGLLRPASVDPLTGYRFYQAGQLAELNRLIALKELGFTLEQVRSIMAETVTAAELRGMLRLRRAEIQSTIKDETARLARVEARLLTIEDESQLPADGIVIKRLGRVRVAELTGPATGYEPEAITPVIQPLYEQMWLGLCTAGVAATGPAVAYYEDAGDTLIVHAAVPVNAEPGGGHGLAIVDLPEVASAAAIIHHGSMDDVLPTVQALARWIDASGYRSAGYAREVALEWHHDPEQWVTELQQPLQPIGE